MGPPTPRARAPRAADGTLRVEPRTTLADGRTLVLRGERVADVVVRDLSPAR